MTKKETLQYKYRILIGLEAVKHKLLTDTIKNKTELAVSSGTKITLLKGNTLKG